METPFLPLPARKEQPSQNQANTLWETQGCPHSVPAPHDDLTVLALCHKAIPLSSQQQCWLNPPVGQVLPG